MKYKLNKYVLGILAITFVMTSCSKTSDELASVASTKQNILTFKTVEEFNTTVQKVNSMKPEERVAWEKSKGFKSFGTICDEFYATIEPQNFKTIEQVNDFVAANRDKIQIYTNEAGDKYCEVQEFDNSARYLMNANRMYIIGNKAFRTFNEGVVSTVISDIETLKMAKSYSELTPKVNSGIMRALPTTTSGDSNNTEIFCEGDVHDGLFGALQTYRLVVRLKAYNTYAPYNTYDYHFIQISNYVWHVVLFSVSRKTSFNISMYVTDIAFGSLLFHPIKSDLTFTDYTAFEDNVPIVGGSQNDGLHITSYNVIASNDKNCSMSVSHVY
jgi:hypothetical protein